MGFGEIFGLLILILFVVFAITVSIKNDEDDGK